MDVPDFLPAIAKAATGIPGMDEITHSGFPRVGATLVGDPEPVTKSMDDLSSGEQVIIGLDLRPAGG